MYRMMQGAGLTETIPFIWTSVLWGQYPAFSHPESPLGIPPGVTAVLGGGGGGLGALRAQGGCNVMASQLLHAFTVMAFFYSQYLDTFKFFCKMFLNIWYIILKQYELTFDTDLVHFVPFLAFMSPVSPSRWLILWYILFLKFSIPQVCDWVWNHLPWNTWGMRGETSSVGNWSS